MQLPSARPAPPARSLRRAPSSRPARPTPRPEPPTRVVAPPRVIGPEPDAEIRAIRLPDRFYLSPRQADAAAGDVMPWPDAVEYVTDGSAIGMRMTDGRVLWMTTSQDELLPAFREEFQGVDVEPVLDGLRRYARLHPRLKYLWQEDLAALEDLAAEREEQAEGVRY